MESDNLLGQESRHQGSGSFQDSQTAEPGTDTILDGHPTAPPVPSNGDSKSKPGNSTSEHSPIIVSSALPEISSLNDTHGALTNMMIAMIFTTVMTVLTTTTPTLATKTLQPFCTGPEAWTKLAILRQLEDLVA